MFEGEVDRVDHPVRADGRMTLHPCTQSGEPFSRTLICARSDAQRTTSARPRVVSSGVQRLPPAEERVRVARLSHVIDHQQVPIVADGLADHLGGVVEVCGVKRLAPKHSTDRGELADRIGCFAVRHPNVGEALVKPPLELVGGEGPGGATRAAAGARCERP